MGVALMVATCNAEVLVLDDTNYTAFTSSGKW
jgi:hypothetical protein